MNNPYYNYPYYNYPYPYFQHAGSVPSGQAGSGPAPQAAAQHASPAGPAVSPGMGHYIGAAPPYPLHTAYPPHAIAMPPARQRGGPLFNFRNERFVRGLLIGATATYILTNEKVQRSTIKGMVRVWSTLQGGLEELKERFQDAEAELRSADNEDEA